MKKQLLLLTCFLSSFLAFSQEESSNYPSFINQTIERIEQNPDWSILVKTSGDLNNDGLTDYSLVLQSKKLMLEKRCNDCKLSKNNARIIVVLLNKEGTNKVTIQNNIFIARSNEGGMASFIKPSLSINKEGELTIYYQYTRSNQSYTFKMNDTQEMAIIKASSNGVHAVSGDFENIHFDFINNNITSKKGNIATNSLETTVLKMDVTPKTLSEFKTMYDWEVIDSKYL